jgi:hypothetical protein
MNSFTIHIQYTPEELHAAYKIHNKKVYPIGSKMLLILGLISILIGAGLLIYSYLSLAFTNWFAWFLIFYGVTVIIFYFWRANNMGKRMFKKMPDFAQPFEFTFSEKGVRIISANANSENSWSYYNNYIITPDLILIYPNKFRFNFFAKEHFTEEQFKVLQSWIRGNIPIPFKR